MINVIIVHGTGGSPEGNWFPWLKHELEKVGYKGFVPKFETIKNQFLENWLKTIKKYEKYLDKNSIVVGHSLGVAFLLNIIEKLGNPIKSAFFVSGFLRLENNLEVNKSFTDRDFDWIKINKNCKNFCVFHSDNDPYIPLEKAKEFAKNLGTSIIVVKNAGHINQEAGYTKFELLLDMMKKDMR